MARFRQRQDGLGNLPQTIAHARGEHLQKPGNFIPPIQREVPSINTGVVPVYNTLPANGSRFTETQLNSVPAISGSTTETIFSKIVPAGRIFYVDRFSVNVEDMLAGATSLGVPTGTFSITLYSNNNSEVFSQNITVQPLDGYYPCLLIGAPNTEIRVDATFDFSANGSPTSVQFITRLTGDVLLPNDLQTEYTALKQHTLIVKDEGT